MRLLCISLACCVITSNSSADLLVNGGFEYPGFTSGVDFYNPTSAGTGLSFGWQTSEPTGIFEIWSGSGYLGAGPAAWEGNSFLELNYQSNQSVWQRFESAGGVQLAFQFAHRGRNGIDALRFDLIEVATGAAIYSMEAVDGVQQWSVHSGIVSLSQSGLYEARFTALSTAGPDSSFGNFLDGISMGVVPAPPAMALFLVGLGRRRSR